MPDLVIKTAEELGDSDVEARAGAVTIAAVEESLPGAYRKDVAKTLATLSDEDLLILRGDSIELAYPFSTSATPFVVRRADGRERFTCCAIDALGIAPMLKEDVEIVTHCHHCKAPLRFAVSPTGPSPDAHDIMMWVTRLRPDDGRACAVL
jgi:alkylmercury lyase-like protein